VLDHGVADLGGRRADAAARQSYTRSDAMSAGPYTVIASHIAATEAYGYETQIVYMLGTFALQTR
jgi:hypothetical protein